MLRPVRRDVRRAAMVVVAMAALGFARSAEAIKIRIKGTAHVEAVATPESEGFAMQGELADDVGVPIGGTVALSLVPEGASRPAALSPPLGCDAAGGARAAAAQLVGDEYLVQTDER